MAQMHIAMIAMMTSSRLRTDIPILILLGQTAWRRPAGTPGLPRLAAGAAVPDTVTPKTHVQLAAACERRNQNQERNAEREPGVWRRR